ncbi:MULTISPECIES: hypothetical protein [Clostridium]|nr:MULTISPECIES: hypothetical protein [Clostridium]
MQEIMILVLEVILLILKMKLSPQEATRETAEKYNVPFSKLWEAVPKSWK